MLAIIDYGVGNLFSLKSSFGTLGVETVVTGDPELLASAERIVLPGVGAFGDAADKLAASGLDAVVREQASRGKPLLGICLGMQLLFERSLEYGVHRGLGLVPGEVVPLSGAIPDGLKIPHIGWNSLSFPAKRCKNELFAHVDEGEYVYFVHSFYAAGCEESLAAYTEYGAAVTAAVANGSVYGTQFHPEKSGDTGLRILRAFCEL